MFTLVLASLRTAFKVEKEPTDYGTAYINQLEAVTPDSTLSASWAPSTMCNCIWSVLDPFCDPDPAYLIAITPPYGTSMCIRFQCISHHDTFPMHFCGQIPSSTQSSISSMPRGSLTDSPLTLRPRALSISLPFHSKRVCISLCSCSNE